MLSHRVYVASKFILMWVLLALPLQRLAIFAAEASGSPSILVTAIRLVDEFTFALLGMAVVVLYVRSREWPSAMGLGPWFVALCALGLLSIVINRVYIPQGILGLYDIIKNVLVIYVAAALRFERDEVTALGRRIVGVGIALAVVALIGEAAAVTFGGGIGVLVNEAKRLGIYRVLSLTGPGSYNYLGVYLTLTFLLAHAIMPDTRWRTGCLCIMAAAIFLTVSRVGWVAFGIACIMTSRALRPVGASFIAGSVMLGVAPLVGAAGVVSDTPNYDPQYYFRTFALREAIDLVRESPLIGIGPGTFGGVVSVVYNSPLYDDWPEKFRMMVMRMRNIDQFWPAVAAEVGFLGLAAMAGLLMTTWRRIRERARLYAFENDAMMAKVAAVPGALLPGIVLMGFAGGLNAAYIAATYFALVGMVLEHGRRTERAAQSHQERNASSVRVQPYENVARAKGA